MQSAIWRNCTVGMFVARAVLAAGLLVRPAAADAQSGAPAARPGRGGVESRYDVSRMGDVVTLSDAQTALVVRVLTPASNAYQMTINGEDVIRRTWNTLDDIRGQLGLNGVPLLWPYANRLDEQAFYANGQKYSFDLGLGNTGRGAIPIHGFVTGADAWKVVEATADARSAWVTTKLDFFRIPRYMKQFPFAHTLTMTYRVQDGALEVHTRIDSLSDERMPIAIGFHPYFQLTDSPREEWRIAIGAKTHWKLEPSKLPTGETEPITQFLPDPKHVLVKDVMWTTSSRTSNAMHAGARRSRSSARHSRLTCSSGRNSGPRSCTHPRTTPIAAVGPARTRRLRFRCAAPWRSSRWRRLPMR